MRDKIEREDNIVRISLKISHWDFDNPKVGNIFLIFEKDKQVSYETSQLDPYIWISMKIYF